MQPVLTGLVFLAALLAPPCLSLVRSRRWGTAVRVVVDPDDPRPRDIAAYLAEIARHLDERPERLRIVFDGRNRSNRAIALDLDPDGTLRVSVDGQSSHALDLRGRWIADHDVPLDLRRAVLYVQPVDANRFRVAAHPPFRVPLWIHVACSLLATAALVVLRFDGVAAALGLSLGCWVASRRSAVH